MLDKNNGKVDLGYDDELRIISEDYINLIVDNNSALESILKEHPKIIMGYEFSYNLAVVYVHESFIDEAASRLSIHSSLSYPMLFALTDIDALDESNIYPVQNHPSLNLRGNGVLIGIVDTGIDYTHPAFIYEDGTSKIKAIWDQNIVSGNRPKNIKYGTEYNSNQINEALKSKNPFDIVPSNDENGHGTFLAGVAAGREEGKYLGAAPDSEILVVKLAPAKEQAKESHMVMKENSVAYQDVDILMACFYLFQKAEEFGRPLSILFGIGSTQGGHEGTTYLMLTGMMPGIVATIACGNEGNAMTHTEGTLVVTGDSYNMEFHVDEREKGLSLYIWGYAPDKLSVSMLSPSGERIEKTSVKNLSQAKYQLIFYNTTIWVNHVFASEVNGDQLTVVRLKNPESGIWRLTLHGDEIVSGKFHAWMLSKNWLHEGTYFLHANPSSTITEFANSRDVIAVGAYNHINGHTFIENGRGPSKNGTIRPDLLAPGVQISGPLPNNSYIARSGTSIAAAHVAGAAALLLEWGIVQENYKDMNTQVVRTILISGANRIPSIKYPNNIYGYGFLDLLQSFKELNMITPHVSPNVYPYFHYSNNKQTINGVYDMNYLDYENALPTILNYSESKSKLEINVFDINEGKPAPGALVKIFNSVTGTIIEELYTNSVGRTKTIELAAPPAEYTMKADVGMLPYREYSVEIVLQSFQTVRLSGIQLFGGNTAIQNVILHPNAQANDSPETIEILPHRLYGEYPSKIAEDEIKPINPSNGSVVLHEPVIPETIVVHAGVPNDRTAKNYYIPFKDYIKNVASCEIYPTWPKETIKANILAILSFTLNRVYTEWYRNKGYNFTITSSTAYDHAFTYGKTFYKEIVTVVDEIFTSYVKRQNMAQPLFTQYCDGRKVSCPGWLSQWGSKSMGDSGHTALNILQNYYGNNIYIAQAQKVSGIPMSYGNTPLRIDSKGVPVRTIQTQLNAISNNYPLIPKLKADGIFGINTQQSVITFQRIFNLTVDGIVGFSTWYKISEIYVAVVKFS